MNKRPLLYVAGPYTRPDPVENTHMAVKVATAIYELTEYVPFVPHITLLWHAITPRPVEFWYDLDLHHLAACDAVVRMPGSSSGADREISVADEIGLPIIAWETLPDEVRSHWLLT